VQVDMRPALFHLVRGRWKPTVRLSVGDLALFQLLFSETGSGMHPTRAFTGTLLIQRPQRPQALAPAFVRAPLKSMRAGGIYTRFQGTLRITRRWIGGWVADFRVTGNPKDGASGRFLRFTVHSAAGK
jgi:hypothetical protein